MNSGFEKNEYNNIQSRLLSEQIIFWVMRSLYNMITILKYSPTPLYELANHSQATITPITSLEP